ncbi:MAG: SMC-Scp complex subunit ScpB [Thermoplasmata archaeon]|uniref:SMC-Scp complex subunit ScpB n=1 Tax=Candidatus Sysuiplasma superficiale TaxID=2823368 RepID=A0A8J8CBR8_9ARCH|nr:SMC-Scp complex subunit ScpB [Candidatus Sysuiplasma superficiale]MBX8643580.1 SMC-Scp complex subunit ScpB [Candidatus Sysuiplasma superficiale]MCL4346961.1 SMC-Scp complex subunit ScpB [Candidatus Thermoplasmatota archaeon]
MDETMLTVEAMLFSSGRPLHPDEIASKSGIDVKEVRKSLRKLVAVYRGRRTSVEIVKIGDKYSMQLRKDFRKSAETMAPTMLSKDLLSTISVIAYYQPVLQSELARKIGPRIYENVAKLRELGLVNVKARAHSLELTTSSRFAEFFGIEAKSSAEVKQFFEKLLSERS